MRGVSLRTKKGNILAYEALAAIFNTSPRVALLPTDSGTTIRSHLIPFSAIAHKGSARDIIWEAAPEGELTAAFSGYGNEARVSGEWIDIRLIL